MIGKGATFMYEFSGLRITLYPKNEKGAAMIRALTNKKETSEMTPATQTTTTNDQAPDDGAFQHVCETLREKLLKLSPQERVEAMAALVTMMGGSSPLRGDSEGLVALVLHPDADFGVEQIQQLYGRGADKNINPTTVITQELLRRGILTEEQLTRTQLAAELAKKAAAEKAAVEAAGAPVEEKGESKVEPQPSAPAAEAPSA